MKSQVWGRGQGLSFKLNSESRTGSGSHAQLDARILNFWLLYQFLSCLFQQIHLLGTVVIEKENNIERGEGIGLGLSYCLCLNYQFESWLLYF